MKYAIIDHVALTAGCAVGSWAGGGFVSPDLSLILAYENPYFIPFASAGGYTSHPFNEKLVALRDFDPPIDSFVGVPVLTWGWTASGGFRIPVIHDVKPRTTPPAVLWPFGFRGAIFDDGWTSLARTRRKGAAKNSTSTAWSASNTSSRPSEPARTEFSQARSAHSEHLQRRILRCTNRHVAWLAARTGLSVLAMPVIVDRHPRVPGIQRAVHQGLTGDHRTQAATLRSPSHSSMKAGNRFQLRIVGVTTTKARLWPGFFS